MKMFRKLLILTVVSLFVCNTFLIGFASENIVKSHFFVFLKLEYCEDVNVILDEIDSEYITEVRELTNPDDYTEVYTPMLLIFVNDADEENFRKAQDYFSNKEYVSEIRYDVYLGSEIIKGDADNNGNVTASDARFVLRCSVGLEEYDDKLLKVCDMNFDNKLTAADARTVLRLSVGLPA